MIENRRPLKSRDTGWARSAAALLARARVSPDAVSASSVVFALIAFAALFSLPGRTGWCGAALLMTTALCVQLRLLANLLDGMVAVEHGRSGPLGGLWNEVPDRIADALFLIGGGYALAQFDPAFGPAMGWSAAVLAVLTAYVRELGRALGQPADFSGPGAKPHRMAALTVGCLVTAVLMLVAPDYAFFALWLTVAVIVALTAATVVRRIVRLARRLKAG